MPHRERVDSLKERNQVPVERYKFAIKCLGDKIKTVVDIGVGMGYGLHLLKEAHHQVIGVDKSSEAIEYARLNYPGVYFVWDVEKLELPDDFDAAVCLETLCHLKNPQKFIDGLKVKELIVSASINPDPNDGYKYRLHNLNEQQFRDMFKEWQIKDEFYQKKYLTLYCKK